MTQHRTTSPIRLPDLRVGGDPGARLSPRSAKGGPGGICLRLARTVTTLVLLMPLAVASLAQDRPSEVPDVARQELEQGGPNWILWLAPILLVVVIGMLAGRQRLMDISASIGRLLVDRLGQLPTVLFLIFFFSFFAIVTAHKPRVLVLHSYATDFSWVNDINVGINWELDKKAYSVLYHYMDTKRNPSEAFKRKAGLSAQRIIREWEPDVLIAVDDNAAQWAAKYFINDPEINIVFTGLNAEPSAYGFDKATNVTGLLERLPFDALKEAFLQILPEGKRRIVHYSDSSETSRAIHREMESFDWRPINVIEHEMVRSFPEWKERILAAPEKADFLLITHYHTIRESEEKGSAVVPPAEVMEWTIENSKIPDVGCWGFYVHDGGMVALGLSPMETGQVAAQMAVQIIDEEISPSDIPVSTSQYYVMYMREPRLKRFNIDMPTVYVAFAHATNNYYEE